MLRNLEAIRTWNDEMLLWYTSLANLSGVLKTGRYQDASLAGYWACEVADDRMKPDGQLVDDHSLLLDASRKQHSEIIAARADFFGNLPKAAADAVLFVRVLHKKCNIGTGSAVKERVEICEDVVVGMGAAVVKDIEEPGVYVGCPAKKIR